MFQNGWTIFCSVNKLCREDNLDNLVVTQLIKKFSLVTEPELSLWCS